MKYRLQILILFLLCSVGKMNAFSFLYDYGLYFNAHEVSVKERTSLYLDDDRPFSIKNDFTITFQVYVRANEPAFGSILHLRTDANQYLRFSFVAGEQNNSPALVFNEGIVTVDASVEREKWLDVSIHLRLADNVVEVDYDNKKISAMAPLQGTKSISAQFGHIEHYLADVAPINLRNITVTQDGKQTREWKLWKHNDDICYDTEEKAIARAVNPFWLIDNHIEWKPIYESKVPGRLDVAFNAREDLFYLVKSQTVEVLDENGVSAKDIPVHGGYPAIEYPNHLLYDTLTNHLVSYHFKKGLTSSFSFDTGRWSNEKRNTDDSGNYNHSKAFNPADSSFYFFGGYGFYQYRNDLFRMKSGTYEVEQISYEPPIDPRYSPAMTVVGDELYIFGGRGNKYGKQELSSSYYLNLCAINLKTNRSRIVWQKEFPQTDVTLMTSSMCFEPSDSSFYAVSMDKGCTLWKISMKDSVYTAVSKSIHIELNYKDYDFSLYTSPSHEKLFLVLDRIQNDHTHDVSIYSINKPLLNEEDIRQTVTETAAANRWYVYVAGGLLLLVAGGLIFRRLRYGEKKNATPASPKRVEEPVVADSHSVRTSTAGSATVHESVHESASGLARESVHESTHRSASGLIRELAPELESVEPVNYYDRSRASISLFGCFNVRDKDGNDITSIFTPRLKHMLILLILYTDKNAKGVVSSKATDLIK